MQTSNLSDVVGSGKANKFLMSKVKGEGHIKDQNNIFGHNFVSICPADIQLVSYRWLWKGKKKFFTSNVKDQDLVRGQTNIFAQKLCSICRTDFQLVLYCSLWKGQYILIAKVKGQGYMKGHNTFLPITLLLFVVQTSYLPHALAYGKANKFFTSKAT